MGGVSTACAPAASVYATACSSSVASQAASLLRTLFWEVVGLAGWGGGITAAVLLLRRQPIFGELVAAWGAVEGAFYVLQRWR